MTRLTPIRLLMVEDSEDDALLMTELLAAAGLVVEPARVDNAADLEAAMRVDGWDAVICDHNLPALDALSALAIVRRHDGELPFIIVSGGISDQQAVAAMHAGAADFVHKDNYTRLAPALERELRAARVRARDAAPLDDITGLPNRNALFEHLARLAASGRQSSPALFAIDLNRFRQINAGLGSLAGNAVLAAVAGRLRELAGAGGYAASLWADRFALVVENLSDQASATRMARAIQEKLAEPLRIGDQELFLGASIGICLDDVAGDSPEACLHRAELALNAAKMDGRNGIRHHHAGMARADQARLTLESALHRALREREFELYYQPQVDLADGRVTGAEALLRWRHPERGLVAPGEFIPALEETGLIVPVGAWALREACARVRAWRDAGHAGMRCAVNLSVIQFRQPDLVERVRAALAETGIPASALELEITENLAMHDEESTLRTLRELDRLGVGLAIDDFGTGYSSLAYLRRYPVDKLKIDRAFVDGIGASEDGAIARAVIAMARSLNLRVVAEGVETPLQAEFLRRHGCQEAQGFLYGRPLPAAELDALLAGAQARAATRSAYSAA
jgi:diguanylate cyclase (GGDEF)-like protein